MTKHTLAPNGTALRVRTVMPAHVELRVADKVLFTPKYDDFDSPIASAETRALVTRLQGRACEVVELSGLVGPDLVVQVSLPDDGEIIETRLKHLTMLNARPAP